MFRVPGGSNCPHSNQAFDITKSTPPNMLCSVSMFISATHPKQSKNASGAQEKSFQSKKFPQQKHLWISTSQKKSNKKIHPTTSIRFHQSFLWIWYLPGTTCRSHTVVVVVPPRGTGATGVTRGGAGRAGAGGAGGSAAPLGTPRRRSPESGVGRPSDGWLHLLGLYYSIWGVSLNGGTQQPWVFLLNLIILGCFGGTIILGNIHIYPRSPRKDH